MPALPDVGAVLFAKDIRRIAAFHDSLLASTASLAQRDLVVLEGTGVEPRQRIAGA